MHSTAGYRGWFTPLMYNAHCTWVGLRLGHVHTTNKPHLSSSVSGPRPPFQGGPGPVLICIRVRLTREKRKEEGDTAPLKAPSSGFITALSAPLSPFAGRCLHEAVCFFAVLACTAWWWVHDSTGQAELVGSHYIFGWLRVLKKNMTQTSLLTSYTAVYSLPWIQLLASGCWHMCSSNTGPKTCKCKLSKPWGAKHCLCVFF